MERRWQHEIALWITDLEEHFAFGEDFRREGVGLEEVGAEIDCHECRTRLIQRAEHQLHSYGNR
jgi:hypothetical protein